MKKLTALLIALMLVLGLAACAAPAVTDAPTDAPAVTDAPTDAPAAPEATETADASAAEDDAAYIADKGTLVIGITLFDPMNYYDDSGKLVGFDTEFAEALCQKLGLTPEFVEINWDTKEIELAAKSIDCIWNGLTVTEERKENMAFSQSYIKNKQCVVVKADKLSDYSDTASLSGATLVAEISSAGESAIAEDESLSKGNYVAVAKQSDALLEVKAGTADAAVLDYVMAKAMVGPDTDYADLAIIDGIELAVEEYAIGFRVGSSFVKQADDVIDALIADGTLQTIAEKYDLAAALLANQ